MEPELFESIQRALAETYQLERELGRGGMATVYLARELKHPRHVAIKVLRPELAGVLTRGRFLREIRISSDLAHPNILPLLDSGVVPATGHTPALPFYTMPFVEGETLRERLAREKQLPVEVAVRIASEIGAALAYAHGRGVIHRDIKPANILLMDGHAVVSDFGIARAVREAVDPDAVTSAGLVIGTPTYMSPEQAGGEQGLDGRSDLYSLGCLLYEMLAGEPPFTGVTPQAVLARHRMDHVPSLRTVRTSVPPAVEQAVLRALEKSPADRFASVTDFVEALGAPPTAEHAAPRPSRRALLTGLAIAAVAFLAWQVTQRPGPLDPNKVVVFPLGETPAGPDAEGTGSVVALMIGTALEYTAPLQWIDGLPRLHQRSTADPREVTIAEMQRIARRAEARWFLEGTIVRLGDSVTVVLRLNDVAGDSVVGRSSATRLAPEAAQAGLAAVNQLLPRLLAPGQRIADLSVLADRRPAAVANWLQGERAYRSFDFPTALEFQRHAVAEDSSLAVAAIRGAQAASWLNDDEEARRFADAAVTYVAFLPGRLVPFARGLRSQISGQADSAVYYLRQALQASPAWTEAHMTLGEVYYHLLPSTSEGEPDSLAGAEFALAAMDSGFSPPRFHLAEIAIRGGDTVAATRAVDDFVRLAPNDASADQRAELSIMLACRLGGPDAVEWRAIAADTPLRALSAARMLIGPALDPGCAAAGFAAVFDDAALSLGERWGGFLGWQGVLAAQGRAAQLRALVDSAVAAGLGLADQLYILDALAGVAVVPDAERVAARVTPSRFESANLLELWLAGEWRARTGDRAGLVAVLAALNSRADRTGAVAAHRYAAALQARLTLLEGDTTAALAQLPAAVGPASHEDLDWEVGPSLAPERLLMAELLLALGEGERAMAAAAVFDHPGPVDFLPFLHASLELRRRAALALGRNAAAERYAARLKVLVGNPDPRRE